MNAVWLLLGLLLLAYLGSGLVGGRAIRGFGLPSGAEYLVLGFALGPHVLGLLGRSLTETFEPVVLVGTGWLALVIGVGFSRVGQRWVRPERAAVGAIFALIVCALVALTVHALAPSIGDFSGFSRLALALGTGAAASETTRHSVRWVVERHGARGKLSDFAADAARGSSLVPPLALTVLFALAPGGPLGSLPALARVAITLGVGAGLGLVTALLLGREFRRDESWGLLLGAGLLCVGVADRLGLSLLGAMFAMGLALTFSRHRLEIRAMVAPTEKPVLLPLLVLAGAYVNLTSGRVERVTEVAGVAFHFSAIFEWARGAALATLLLAKQQAMVFLVVGLAVGVKFLARMGLGGLLALGPARGTGLDLGLSMMASGGLSIAAALALRTRAPGIAADSVLLFAAVSLLIGELVAPAALRRSLAQHDELHSVPPDEIDDGNRPSTALPTTEESGT